MEDNLLNKFTDWYEKLSPVSSLSFKVVAVACLYTLLTIVLPPFWIKLFWDTVVWLVLFIALGVFLWHETVGVAAVMQPLYKLLYRITGDEYYQSLTNLKGDNNVERSGSGCSARDLRKLDAEIAAKAETKLKPEPATE